MSSKRSAQSAVFECGICNRTTFPFQAWEIHDAQIGLLLKTSDTASRLEEAIARNTRGLPWLVRHVETSSKSHVKRAQEASPVVKQPETP